jgi:hypothetical protein
MMSAMTYVLILLWRPPMLAAAVFAFLSLATSVKFVAKRSEEEDRNSFHWYEVRGIPSSRNTALFNLSSGLAY